MAAPKSEQVTAGLAVAHLYRRFPPPEFFCAHEVSLYPGEDDVVPFPRSGQSRRADFLALRLWGSRLGHLLGFEVKVSRSDFLQEIREPEKRAPLEALCAACYFVSPRGIFDPGELPAGWGWMEVRPSGLIMRREASHRAAATPVAVYHTLMKRLHDIRWYDRAKRPALVDWPKEVFQYAGMPVTPGKLASLAAEVFHSTLHDRESAARSAGRAESAGRVEEAEREAQAFRRMLGDVLGLSHWDWSGLTPEKAKVLLLASMGSGTKVGPLLKDLDDVDAAFIRAQRSLRAALDRLRPQAPATPP